MGSTLPVTVEESVMNVRPTIKAICDHCKVIRRHGRVVLVHVGSAGCERSA